MEHMNLVGKKVGSWEVVGEVGIVKGMRTWRCRCACGYERNFTTSYLNTGLPSRCPNCRKCQRGTSEEELRQHYVGRKIGKYTVVALQGRNKYGSRLWLCRCECGTERVFLTSDLSGNGKRKATQCPDCSLREMESRNRIVTEVPYRFWKRLTDQAARRGVKVEMTQAEAAGLFLQQEGKCGFTGIPIYFTNLRTNYSRYTTASLDRKDHTQPYKLENVHWVHKTVNLMRSILGMEEFKEWCIRVADYTRGGEQKRSRTVAQQWITRERPVSDPQRSPGSVNRRTHFGRKRKA